MNFFDQITSIFAFGKDEVGSSNLPSSSKKADTQSGICFFALCRQIRIMSAHAGGMCVEQFKNCSTPLFLFASPAGEKKCSRICPAAFPSRPDPEAAGEQLGTCFIFIDRDGEKTSVSPSFFATLLVAPMK